MAEMASKMMESLVSRESTANTTAPAVVTTTVSSVADTEFKALVILELSLSCVSLVLVLYNMQWLARIRRNFRHK